MSIDPDFSSKLKKDGEHSGHDVWDEVKPPRDWGFMELMSQSTTICALAIPYVWESAQ